MDTMIRILIVDDHVVVRKGYFFMLKTFNDMKLVGEAETGKQAIEYCQSLQPDVILMDIHLPEMNGIEAIRTITERFPDTKIIALTSFESDTTLVQKALEAGAKGFVYKTTSIKELATAIRQVNQNKSYLSSEATENLIESKTSSTTLEINLTTRERDVLGKLSQGLSNKEIAVDLQLSPNTIKFHIRSLLRKLNVSTRTEAVSIALNHNLIDS